MLQDFSRFAVLAMLAVFAAAPTQAKDRIDAVRGKAIHDCNDMANKFRQRTWGKTEFTLYRVCMAERDQKE